MVGWQGGVGRAVLALLAHHPRGRALAAHRDLLLVDAEPGALGETSLPIEVLPAQRIGDQAALHRLIVETGAHELIDLAGLDWQACLAACGALGVDSLGTSLERWAPPSRAGLLDDAWQLAPGRRPVVTRGSHVLATGMNPGCVNALVDTAMRELVARTGVADKAALDIGAIHVTERDTTDCDVDGDGFASSWSPVHCQAELLAACAPWVDRGEPRSADHEPWQSRYRVRCGDAIIEGNVVPHDEIVTLSWRYPEVELAYIVELPPRARRWLHADPRSAAASVRMWPPHTGPVRGRDVVGVLLCSRRHGELWCGFDTDCATAAAFGTNATLLQVAAGVIAGWHRLGERAGVHVIEELDTAAFVDDVAAILGPWQVVHDASAPFTALADRRCSP